MSNDDVKFVFSPQDGEAIPSWLTPATSAQYRSSLPHTIWYYNPWTGEKRSTDQVHNDPHGHAIVPVAIEDLVADLKGCREHNARLESELSRARDNYRDLREELRQSLKQTSDAIMARDEALKMYNGQLQVNVGLVKQRDAAERKHGELSRLNAEIASQLANARKALDTQVHRVIEQQKTINDLRATVHRYAESIAAGQRQRDELQRRLTDLVDKVTCPVFINEVTGIPKAWQSLNDRPKTVAGFSGSGGFVYYTPGVRRSFHGAEVNLQSIPKGTSFKGMAHLFYGGEGSASLQRKIARQAKTLREQEVLIEKLKARLRAVPKADDKWCTRSAQEIASGQMPENVWNSDRVQVVFRNGGSTVSMADDLRWGEIGQHTIIKWRRAS